MHLVDLWHEKAYNRYLKSNQMLINKKKLLKEIRVLEEENQSKLLSSKMIHPKTLSSTPSQSPPYKNMR